MGLKSNIHAVETTMSRKLKIRKKRIYGLVNGIQALACVVMPRKRQSSRNEKGKARAKKLCRPSVRGLRGRTVRGSNDRMHQTRVWEGVGQRKAEERGRLVLDQMGV